MVSFSIDAEAALLQFDRWVEPQLALTGEMSAMKDLGAKLRVRSRALRTPPPGQSMWRWLLPL